MTQKLTRRMREFFAQETSGGIIMLFAAMLALWLVNSSEKELYESFLHARLPGGIDVHFLIADILMPLFFLLVGLELKHEMLDGALASRSQRALPLMAALGGIAFPALLYLLLTRNSPELGAGWAVPTATDIAFAICVLMLGGKHVPPAAKIFLLAIAIYDDLAAIIIIALFYTGDMNMVALAAAGGVLALMLALNRFTRAAPWPMALLGVALGLCLYNAGIHTTVAGMVTGLCIGRHYVRDASHRLHPIVTFTILPLFALANAGVDFSGIQLANLFDTLPLAIALALVIGKPLGIVLLTLGTVKLGLAQLPERTTVPMLVAIGMLAGIGFTMSLFIGQLAFPQEFLRNEVRLGVMGGSLISGLLGILMLRLAAPKAD